MGERFASRELDQQILGRQQQDQQLQDQQPLGRQERDQQKLRQWFLFSYDARSSRPDKVRWLAAGGSAQTYLQQFGKPTLSSAQKLIWQQTCEFTTKHRHYCLTPDHSSYPAGLNHCTDPAHILYAIGDLTVLESPSVSIVGSRRPTDLGVRAVESLGSQLADLGITITSGLALGIDSVAHRMALRHGAATVAVMPCGADTVYPARHRGLYEQIIERGLVVSEYPPHTKAAKYRFAQRNRLISGISVGTLIVEAAQKSGTLITARWTMEQDRVLMVVPGSVFNAQYQGSHRLIQQGAYLVQSSEDVLELLADPLATHLSQYKQMPASADNCGVPTGLNKGLRLDKRYAPIVEPLQTADMPVDQIIEHSGLTASEVSAMLLLLEVDGIVACTPDGRYYLS